MRNHEVTTRAPDTAGPLWLTVSEMARRVRLHPKTLLRLARARLIPCLRAGRAVRFSALEVEQALMRRPART